MAENKAFAELLHEIYGQRPNLGFVICGSVPIDVNATEDYGGFTTKDTPLTSPPIDVYWSGMSGEDRVAKGLATFPIVSKSNKSLMNLAYDCQPTMIEYNGKQRVAGNVRQMPSQDFSVKFEPHKYGILDAAAQVLLPAHNGSLMVEPKDDAMANDDDRNHYSKHWGLKANLLKLSVSWTLSQCSKT